MCEATESCKYDPPKDYSIKTLRDKHKKHSKLNKTRFDKFINQKNKYFCSDIWNEIKSYAIDKKYLNSSFYQEHDEIKIKRHICSNGEYNTPYTSILIGRRFDNLLQIAFCRENYILIDNPIFKMYKTHMNASRYKLTEDTHSLLNYKYGWDNEENEDELFGEWWDDEREVWRDVIPKAFRLEIHAPSCLKIIRLGGGLSPA